jgi:hypothetical protein
MREVTFEFGLGDIWSTTKDAIAFAKKHVSRDGLPVKATFVFNGISVCAYSSSEPLDVTEKYFLRNKIKRLELGYED